MNEVTMIYEDPVKSFAESKRKNLKDFYLTGLRFSKNSLRSLKES